MTRARLVVMGRLVGLALLVSTPGAALAKDPLPKPQRDVGPQPVLPPPPIWRAPVPTESIAPSGLRVVTLLQTNVPIVHVTVLVRAGAELDPPGQRGLASAVATMLEQGGAGKYTGPQLSAAFEALGDELAISTDHDGVTLGITVQSRDLPRALALLADVLARPRFDAAEWARVRTQTLASIVRMHDEPRIVADQVFQRVLFGDKHPYGSPVIGSEASVAKLSPEDLRSFYDKHYGARATTLLLVGDVPAKLAPRLFEGSSAKPVRADAPGPAPAEQARFLLVDRPGAPQSELRVGHLGLARKSRDHAPASLLEMALGGSFTSRLNQNLREKHGYTYGARARFAFANSVGPVVVKTAVRSDVTAPALQEVLNELAAIGQPFQEAEVGKARALVLNSLIEGFGDGDSASGFIADLIEHGLPLDGWAKFPLEVAGQSVATLAAASGRLFRPALLTIVVVGDRELIEAKLRALPMGKTLEIVGEDGRVLATPLAAPKAQ